MELRLLLEGGDILVVNMNIVPGEAPAAQTEAGDLLRQIASLVAGAGATTQVAAPTSAAAVEDDIDISNEPKYADREPVVRPAENPFAWLKRTSEQSTKERMKGWEGLA